MFSLYYTNDASVKYNGINFNVNLAFDNVLRLIDLLEEDTIDNRQKLVIGLKMLFGKDTELLELPINEQIDVFNQAFNLVGQGEKKEKTYDLAGNEMPQIEGDDKQYYSFRHDAEFIYSSFMQAYGIDLIEQQGKLDWYKFQALLSGLPEDTKFRQVVSVRVWEPPSKKDNYKQQMRKLQEYYKLPEE